MLEFIVQVILLPVWSHVACHAQIVTITKDDYFAKNAEFTAWLRDEKGKLFNDMDADETRALFGRHDCQT